MSDLVSVGAPCTFQNESTSSIDIKNYVGQAHDLVHSLVRNTGRHTDGHSPRLAFAFNVVAGGESSPPLVFF